MNWNLDGLLTSDELFMEEPLFGSYYKYSYDFIYNNTRKLYNSYLKSEKYKREMVLGLNDNNLYFTTNDSILNNTGIYRV